jgi:hypothetical protein
VPRRPDDLPDDLTPAAPHAARAQFGEYVENSGAVSKYSYRLRVKQLSTGHQATVTPFGVNMQSVVQHLNDTLSPTFFHFGYKPNGAPQSVSTFVSTSTGRHAFHYGHGEAEWKAFMNPFLTTYWAAMVKDYNLREVVASRRKLTWEDDVASVADDAINWGEGEVNSWAGDEAGAAGADIGEAVGSKVGGYIGEAAGSAIAGPVGAAVGSELGSWAGGEAGSYFGKKYGSELGSDVASEATSAIGDSLKSSVNSWAASSDSSSSSSAYGYGGGGGGGGGFSYSG